MIDWVTIAGVVPALFSAAQANIVGAALVVALCALAAVVAVCFTACYVVAKLKGG